MSDKVLGVAIAFWITSSGCLIPPKHLTLPNPFIIDTIGFFDFGGLRNESPHLCIYHIVSTSISVRCVRTMGLSQYIIKKIEACPLSGNNTTLSNSVTTV